MRSVRDLLRDYNFVNTTEGRRNTVRFFAGLLALAAGGVMVLFIAIGGADPADSSFQAGSKSDDQFRVTATQISTAEWYIGYAVEQYDPDQQEQYSEEAIQGKLQQWQDDYGAMIGDIESVRSSDEHNVLLGYKVQLTRPISIGVLSS